MIKEFWILVKMLFCSKPRDFSELVYYKMKYFPFPGYSAMTWCGRLIYKESVSRNIITWTHENIHLAQAKTNHSSWLSFYLSYLWSWLIGFIFLGWRGAYLTIPEEVEAYANEDNPGYWKTYPWNNLKSKYSWSLKERVRLYKEHKTEWKTWIKSL